MMDLKKKLANTTSKKEELICSHKDSKIKEKLLLEKTCCWNKNYMTLDNKLLNSQNGLTRISLNKKMTIPKSL